MTGELSTFLWGGWGIQEGANLDTGVQSLAIVAGFAGSLDALGVGHGISLERQLVAVAAGDSSVESKEWFLFRSTGQPVVWHSDYPEVCAATAWSHTALQAMEVYTAVVCPSRTVQTAWLRLSRRFWVAAAQIKLHRQNKSPDDIAGAVGCSRRAVYNHLGMTITPRLMAFAQRT